MRKYIIIITVCCVFAMILAGCGSSIKSAENTVRREFFLHWTLKGYELIDLQYDAKQSEEMKKEAAEGEDVAVFTSSFKTPGKTEGSLSPDRVYTGWGWILKRSKNSGWKIVNYGFG